MTSTRLDTARRALAQEIGPFGVYTAGAGGTGTTIVCDAVFKSTELPSTAFAYQWVYVPSATSLRSRRIKAAGLDGGTGTITLENAIDITVGNGVVFELHSRLPAAREPFAGQDGQATVMGLLECLNAAVRHVLIPDTVSLPLVDGQYDYSLTGWPWLDRPGRLRSVDEWNATGTTKNPTWRTWSLREDADGPVLHVDQPYRFSSGSYSDDLYVLRPADTKIKLDGATSYTDSTLGLVAEGDECGLDLNTLVTVGLVFAYKALAVSRHGSDRARYEQLYAAQVVEARKVRGYDHENDIDPTVAQQQQPTSAGAAA